MYPKKTVAEGATQVSTAPDEKNSTELSTHQISDKNAGDLEKLADPAVTQNIKRTKEVRRTKP